MPRAKRVCTRAGCPNLQPCPDHAKDYEKFRGTSTARGYGVDHQQLRARWVPIVASGMVKCRRCGKPIRVGQAWALDHTDDRTGYLGPSHERCNNRAGGRARHRRPGG